MPAGRTLAVVGPSGAGKSTLARLLFRFYEPSGGRIPIDGQEIARGAQASLARRDRHRAAGYRAVQRHHRLQYRLWPRGSLAGRDRGGGARALRSTTSSSALPDGYDSRVGERGLKLSGGEKQRVAIARTLLKDPPILILDEATSALDSRTEARDPGDAGATSPPGAPRIIIAHRLSTIVDADQIVVLEDGRVAETGHP